MQQITTKRESSVDKWQPLVEFHLWQLNPFWGTANHKFPVSVTLLHQQIKQAKPCSNFALLSSLALLSVCAYWLLPTDSLLPTPTPPIAKRGQRTSFRVCYLIMVLSINLTIAGSHKVCKSWTWISYTLSYSRQKTVWRQHIGKHCWSPVCPDIRFCKHIPQRFWVYP